MDLLKKHYEKIVLGGVLLVLVVSAALLPVMIGSERDSLKAKSDEIIKLPAKPLDPLNLSTQQLVLQRIQAGVALDLATTHKTFNPVFWQKTPDGKLIKIAKGDETGPKALTVTKHTPLYLTITLDSVNPGEGATPTRYVIGVEREAAAEVSKRRKKQYYATVDNKNDAFVVRKVNGPPENPDSLVLELAEGGDEVILKKGEPFKRVDGYMVDLKYELEKKTWTNQRVSSTSTLRFGNEEYIIVAITKNEIVVLAKSNQKKTPVPIP
jgi:hypothetical protein